MDATLTRPLLLAHARSPQHLATFRRLGAIGCDLRFVDDLKSAIGLINDGGGDALLLCIEASEAPLLDSLTPEARRRTAVVAERASRELLRSLDGRRVGLTVIKVQAVAADDLISGLLKLLREDLFGIEKYLAWGTVVQRLSLTESLRRGEAIDTLDLFLSSLGLDARLVGQTLTMADEFITNAFYNAPTDETGRRRFAHMQRIEPIRCEPDKPIQLTWGCDGSRVAVGVSDCYGSLRPSSILTQVAAAIEGASVNMESSGAGLGLVTAFHGASQLIFNLLEGKTTEAIGLVDVSSFREFLEQGKTVHIFHQAGKAQ